ncbi:MAG: glycosyltransferase [Acidobacteriota bacterium]|jgi:glycosyltransferase involved in cell wall biosynthesis
MKVLMLTSSYPLPEDPTWGPFVRTLARGVAGTGATVRVLVFSPGRRDHRFTGDDGIEVVSYRYTRFARPALHRAAGLVPSVRRSWRARLQLPAYAVASIATLRRHVDRLAPDVVHAHWLLPGGWIARHALRGRRPPLVTTAWGADLYLPARWPLPGVLRRVERASARVVAVSEHLRRRAAVYGLDPGRMRVIPNGVDTRQLSPPDPEAPPAGPLVVGTARRLVPEKRVDDLLEAVAALPADERDRVEIRIAGDGPERPRLEGRAGALGIAGRTRFLGSIRHEDMAGFHRGLDLFLNPSVQEGMATANLEAMACGVPVLGYLGVGNDEVVRDGENGFLVPSGEVPALTGRLRALLADPALRARLGRAARRTVLGRFSQEAVGRAYRAVYDEVARR